MKKINENKVKTDILYKKTEVKKEKYKISNKKCKYYFGSDVLSLEDDGSNVVSTFVHYILRRRREVYEKENVP